MAYIIPKRKAPGVDFCGSNGPHYIIRSDLGFYMRSGNLQGTGDNDVFRMHNSSKGGNHYLVHDDGFFYIITKNAYWRVNDMKESTCDAMYNLHPNCQEGDHYLFTNGYFYIIFQSKSCYRKVKNLSTDEDGNQYSLHPNCMNGLYYWGDCKNTYFYFVNSQDESNVKYYRCNDLHNDSTFDVYTFCDDVVNFLPGGLAVTCGSASGKWDSLITIPNDTSSVTPWNDNINRKLGWKKGTASFLNEAKEAIVKYQLSLPVRYGGMGVNTDQEEWGEVKDVVQFMKLILQPRKTINIRQYNLYLGKNIVLFSHYTDISDNVSTPPTYIPLPPYNN